MHESPRDATSPGFGRPRTSTKHAKLAPSNDRVWSLAHSVCVCVCVCVLCNRHSWRGVELWSICSHASGRHMPLVALVRALNAEAAQRQGRRRQPPQSTHAQLCAARPLQSTSPAPLVHGLLLVPREAYHLRRVARGRRRHELWIHARRTGPRRNRDKQQRPVLHRSSAQHQRLA